MLLSFFKRKANGSQISPVTDTTTRKRDEPVIDTELPAVKVLHQNKKLLPSSPSWKDAAFWAQWDTNADASCERLREALYDELRLIRDPERPSTLEELNVLTENSVKVKPLEDGDGYYIRIEFNPTIPHCSLASLIGLCLRTQIQRHVVERFKLDIVVAAGSHATEEEVNKQINDKERVTAALENPNLHAMVESCLKEGQE